MADKSAIEWTDATWNPIRARNLKTGRVGWHCVHETAGCANCYAEGFNLRLGTGLPYKPGHEKDIEIFLDEKTLLQPLKWKRPRMIFPFSMTDLFAPFVTDEMLDRIFAVMALCPQHTFQVLTKRSARMRAYMTKPLTGPWAGRATRDGQPSTDVDWRVRAVVTDMLAKVPAAALNRAVDVMDKRDGGEGDGFFRLWRLPNVWLGVSCEDQQRADDRLPDLLVTPAAVRFVSAEPLLGPIDLKFGQWIEFFDEPTEPDLDWVIVGGESGAKARPMHPDWARQIRDQCAASGVPFFFKQWGANEWAELITDHREEPWRRWPDGHEAWFLTEHGKPKSDLPKYRPIAVGKKRAGRLLDGREHNDMPVRQ